MIKLEDIKEAEKMLKDVTNITPCDHSVTYSNITGGDIHLKLENIQRTGSFMARGAYCKVASLKGKNASVITASGGNHAQAVAFAAAKCKRNATIVMPVVTPSEKVQATKNYGADVILHGQNVEEAHIHAMELLEDLKSAHYIHPFDDAKIQAGYGTVGLEIMESMPDVQAIVVPIGGGGLISGVAVAAKTIKPDIKIIGVQASGSCAMKNSIDNKQLVELDDAKTIADGVAVRSVCKKTLDITRKYVDEIVVVDDEEIASVILMLLDRSKLLVEGAGALSLTAALYGKTTLHDLKTVLIVSGGNIDMNFLSKIIERGLIKAGRLVHITVDLPDAPGVLSLLTGIIGDFGVNIISVKQIQDSFELPFRQTKVDLTLEVKGFGHIDELLKLLRAKGYEANINAD